MNSKYKRVQLQHGGGTRKIEYLPDEATVNHMLENAKGLFFPEGKSLKGHLCNMKSELGNFQHEVIKSFKDRDGIEVTLPEYLKSYGLYAGRTYLFLMTTGIETDEGSLPSTSDKETNDGNNESNESMRLLKSSFSSSSMSSYVENPLLVPSSADVLLGKGVESVESLTSVSSNSRTPYSDDQVFLPSSAEANESWVCTNEWINSHNIFIQYELSTHSLYSDQEVSISSFSRERCYEVATTNDPAILETPFNEFQPPESNFTITNIVKGEQQYLVQVAKDSSNEICGPETFYEFPMASVDETSVILHHPCDVWGFDNKQLIIAVISTRPDTSMYTWYRNGIECKEGFNYSCLAVTEEGEYSVKVRCDGKQELSRAVQIVKRIITSQVPPECLKSIERREMQDENRITLVENEESETVSYGIPMIEKKDLHYDPKIDEIGRGTFGAVYKASWAGTSVAVKQMKVRQIKLITNILKSEVQVHSKIRHPNIVQIMAVAIGKSAIYIVSELVNIANLEDLLFSDEDDDGCSFTIPSDKKVFIGRQIVQAVAYLHNRKPPILHRDIKPANVLVASESYVTKLCDMGLGKIKSAQTTSHVTSANIAGTPNYMSPECLVEKAKATTKADVWSLACTLVELFTGKDCWGQIEDNFADESEDSSYAICCCLKAKELPRAFQYILTENENLKAILMKCFDYDAEKWPDAIQILDYF